MKRFLKGWWKQTKKFYKQSFKFQYLVELRDSFKELIEQLMLFIMNLFVSSSQNVHGQYKETKRGNIRYK